jgi:hypothetical protein
VAIKVKNELAMNNPAYQRERWKLLDLKIWGEIFEDITNPTDSMNEFVGKIFVNFSSQPANQHIYDIGLGIKMKIPNMFQDHHSGDGSFCIPHEIFQQGKLALGQVDSFPGPIHLVFIKIQR